MITFSLQNINADCEQKQPTWAEMKSWLLHWIRLLLLGESVFFILVLRDPGFADQIWDFLLWFLVIPTVAVIPLWFWETVQPTRTNVASRFRSAVWGLTPFVAVGVLAAFHAFSTPVQVIATSGTTLTFVFVLLRLKKAFFRLTARHFSPYLVVILALTNGTIVVQAKLFRPVFKGIDHVLLFCPDGADWRIIDSLIEKGELPNFEALLRNGCRADLVGQAPLYSPILWTTIATGRTPAEHGLWARIDDLNASMIRCRRVWDIVEMEGKSCGAVQYLGLWPLGDSPSSFAIPSIWEGGLGSRPPGYDFICQFVQKKFQGLTPGDLARFGIFCWWRGLRLSTATLTLNLALKTIRPAGSHTKPIVAFNYYMFIERMYEDIFCHFYRTKPVDLAIYYFPLTDGMEHRFMRAYQPQSFQSVNPEEVRRLGTFIPETYREMDRALGRFKACVGENASILVLSDHGMSPITEMLPKGCSRIYNGEGSFPAWLGYKDEIDWLQGFDRIFLVPKDGSGVHWRGIMERAVKAHLVGTEKPIWKVGFRDAFGHYLPDGPEDPAESGFIELTLQIPDDFPDSAAVDLPVGHCTIGDFTVFPEEFVISGAHYPQGIFLASGPGIRKNETLAELSQLDVLPTLLAMMKLPRALDLRGNTADIFTRKFEASLPQSVVTYEEPPWIPIPSPSEKEMEILKESVQEQMRARGYIN